MFIDDWELRWQEFSIQKGIISLDIFSITYKRNLLFWDFIISSQKRAQFPIIILKIPISIQLKEPINQRKGNSVFTLIPLSFQPSKHFKSCFSFSVLRIFIQEDLYWIWDILLFVLILTFSILFQKTIFLFLKKMFLSFFFIHESAARLSSCRTSLSRKRIKNPKKKSSNWGIDDLYVTSIRFFSIKRKGTSYNYLQNLFEALLGASNL